MSLTSYNSARNKIKNSGYLIYIEKLVEAEVSNTRKIVRNSLPIDSEAFSVDSSIHNQCNSIFSYV